MVAKTANASKSSAGGRNGNIDALRLIAAIGVISLHVGPYPELPAVAADIIRSTFRWCVPFFFMLTGYYLFDPQEGAWRITIEKMALPLRAFVIASVIFLPVLVVTAGPDGITLSTLLRGTYGHLWYLTALLVALLAIYTYRSGPSMKMLTLFAGLIVVGYVAITYFNAFTGKRYDMVITFRELSGIPAVLIGGWLRSLSNLCPVSLRLLLAGLAITVVEMVCLSALGGRPSEVQLFVGTLPMAAGLLGVAISSNNVAPRWLSELGRRESFGIYLYHPVAILITASVLSMDVQLNTKGVPGLFLWIMASILTIAGLLLLRAGLPLLRTALDGIAQGGARTAGGSR